MLKISQSACKRSTAGTHLVQSVHPRKTVSLRSKACTLKSSRCFRFSRLGIQAYMTSFLTMFKKCSIIFANQPAKRVSLERYRQLACLDLHLGSHLGLPPKKTNQTNKFKAVKDTANPLSHHALASSNVFN